MKRIMKIAAFALVLVLGSAIRNDVSAQYRGDVSYQTFYDELSPHGQWIDYPSYGYVWVPNAGRDFRPYATSGHWVWTDDYEWMWVSDYDWGWAPFHYGRWFEDDYYGWVWVPGYEWSPAWVAWRDGGDYYGWAPLRPGINISINFNLGSYAPPHSYWCFVPRRYIASTGWYGHRVDYRRNVTIINQTTIINNYNYTRNVFRTGPRRSSVEVYTGRINPVRLRESNNPGRTVFRNNEVTVFRPQVRQDNNRQFRPSQVQRYEDRNTNNRNNGGSNNNVFRRNNSNVNNGRNDNDNANAERRSNNLPRRQVFERNEDRNVRQQSTENRTREQRRIANPSNNDRQRNTPNERRVFRSQDQQERRVQQQGNTENRRVFRSQGEQRQPQVRQQAERQRPQMQQRPQTQRQPQRVEQPRRIERSSGNTQPRSNGNGNGRVNKRF